MNGMEQHATSWVADTLDTVLCLAILMIATNTVEFQSLLGILNLLSVLSHGVGTIISVAMPL